jgi:hypothetical protein
MAEKRRIKVSGPEQKEIEEEDELPRKFRDMTWKEWLKQDFARYWFIATAFGIDVLFGLEVMYLITGMGSLGFALFLAVMVPLEVLVYLYLWGKKGILISQ